MCKRSILGMLAIGVLVVILSGCSAAHHSLAPQEVLLHRQNSEKVEILRADVYQAHDGTWVSGVLKQQHFGTAAVRVHVDVRVFNPAGTLVYETVSDDVLVPRDRLGKGLDWKRFRIQLPDTPAAGSHINMTVHSGLHHADAAS